MAGSVDLLKRAIEQRCVIAFNYNGSKRVLEPHQLGYSRFAKKLTLVGYQLSGYSESNRLPPWRQFSVAKMHDVLILSRDIKVNRIGLDQSGFALNRPISEID